MVSSHSQAAFGWLVGALLIGGILVWALVTQKSWWWGRLVSRSDNPAKYWSGVMGVAIPAVLCALTAFENFGR